MSSKSKIEWTESTWNPITGCSKISEGCTNCYAFSLANRLQKMGNAKYSEGFSVRLHPRTLNDPLARKKPSVIFVNSMSDIFHEDVPNDYIMKIFDVMNEASWHTFQILTKRDVRMVEMSGKLRWGRNIWMGVTVENDMRVNRIDALKTVPANIKFVSFEPLLSDMANVDLHGIDWAIVGGESGSHARPMMESWALNVKSSCERAGALFYFKQWGGHNKKKNGRLLQGKTWDDSPALITRKAS
ncbi:MAG: phage Gp37/Gp68 family protein [Synergistaceae bacterium]|jgi:protein gp37|nr:phage Gp37/Gp68 family protein [Synergistaceae bacterium]